MLRGFFLLKAYLNLNLLGVSLLRIAYGKQKKIMTNQAVMFIKYLTMVAGFLNFK